MPLASVRGRKLYYESHGEGPGPPLVLVMGMAGSCSGWLALQVPELSKRRRVVIFENRGVGVRLNLRLLVHVGEDAVGRGAAGLDALLHA